MAINFRGYLFQDDGDAVNGATVQLLETGTTTVEASTTTDSNGLWYFNEGDQDKYDVKITSGTSVRYIRWDDQISLKEIDIRNNTGNTTPAATFTNLTNNAANQVAVFSGANTTRADDDEIYTSFKLANSAAELIEYGRMTVVAKDVTDGTEDGQIEFDVMKAGTLTKVWTITSSDAAAMSFDMNVDSLTIGSGADTDISLTFDANTADGVITWMEDEDYFKFSDEILMNSTEKILFGDTGTFIHQSSDGVLTITSDTTVDINGAVVFDGAITGATNITLSGELDAATLDISGNADIDGTLEADAYTVDGTTLAEYIADTVGAMVTSNTESGITVAYQDGDNTLDFTVGTLNQDTTGTAAIATTVTITDNESTNEDNALIFTAGGDVDGGNLGLESDGTLTYNPSTGKVTATGFIGTLTGNVTGDVTGNVTGNASGTALTVTQAAQSAITSLGTLTALTVDDVVVDGKVITMTGSSSDTAVFTAGTNGTLSIVTTDAAAAAANIQITADGTAELAGTTVTLDSAGDIELEATNDVKLPNDIGLIFGDAGEKIEGDGTDLTISYSGAFNVTGSAPGEATFTTGNFIVDSTGDITLDAAGHDILLKAAGTSFGNLTNDSTNFEIKSTVSDKDMIFKGNDGGSEINALTFDMSAAGSAVFGAATAAQSVEGTIPQVQIHGTSSATTRMVIGSFQANGNEGRMQFIKSRNATIGSSTIVQDGDNLGQITFCADDGTDYESVGARIMASIDGTPGANDTPGRLVFHTTPDGSQGTTERMRIDSTGSVLIGDTANGNQTVGLTVNMADNTNEIITLKSSDVTHGMTGQTEADTFGTIVKGNNSQGMPTFTGYSSGTRGLQLVGNHTTDNTSQASDGNSAIMVRANLYNGSTGLTSCASGANIFGVRNAGSVVYLIDGAGDVHYDGSTNAGAWDDYDDIALLDTVRAVTTNDYKGVFSNFTEEHTEVLDKTGVITMNDDGHHFISTKGLNGLMIDSIRQLSQRTQESLEELKEENKQLRQKLEALEV